MGEIRQFSLDDVNVGPLLLTKEAEEKSSLRHSGPTLGSKMVAATLGSVRGEKGCPMPKFKGQDGLGSHMQLVLPKSLQEEALQELHEGARVAILVKKRP